MKTDVPIPVALVGWATAALLTGLLATNLSAATLTGNLTAIPRNSTVNLSAAGPVDWVHWGLYSEASVDRKVGVLPLISGFTTVLDEGDTNAFVYAYQFADNYNGYSWNDGTPLQAITDTHTGVWAYGEPNIGTGFEFTVPADDTERTLKVYVGAYAAQGRFEATLSDSSAGPYSDSSFDNKNGSGPSGTYTITFAAASAGQTLNIRWTVLQNFRPDGNVTLQAAALTVAGANNPPSVAVGGPMDNDRFAAPADLRLEATASDLDGSIIRVEFYANNQLVAEDATHPYRVDWNGVGPGVYLITAVAYDDGGEVSESEPVEIFVHGTGGSLVATTDLPAPSVNLTSEGAADWAHWGLATNTSFNRKFTTTQQIGNFVTIGGGPVQRYADNFTGYSWTDGTPTATASASHTGVFIIGQGQGFALDLPADLTPRTAKIYVGLYGAQGNFQAYLSDFSAPAYTDESLADVFGNTYAVYTITYTAASQGQTLHVRHRAKQLYDNEFGNVTLQAVTLVGGNDHPNQPPVVALLTPTNAASFFAPASIQLTASASDDGGLAKVEFFQGADWLGEDPIGPSPYSFTWNNVPPGTYLLSARATDNFGAIATSASVTITVSNSPPQAVTLLNPSWSGDAFTFSFASQPSQTYEVQSSEQPGLDPWQSLQMLTGDGSVLTVTDANLPPGQRFYRVLSK
ncbi:MAG TPA: Ig-like domain-containing protein [Verrucomicrobiae bacterium]|nr:Ig-like domain-containing protein [Verrucomicrobiae bacterium]